MWFILYREKFEDEYKVMDANDEIELAAFMKAIQQNGWMVYGYGKKTNNLPPNVLKLPIS